MELCKYKKNHPSESRNYYFLKGGIYLCNVQALIYFQTPPCACENLEDRDSEYGCVCYVH